ncbi:hypothetical protein A2U01_0091449, partial [Trifolium medium]|nr:hypothetical protein [Trifolium medium]
MSEGIGLQDDELRRNSFFEFDSLGFEGIRLQEELRR